MKPLEIKQRTFKADEITYLDRKAIQLDRMLLRLFELLRYDGRQAVRTRRRAITVNTLVAQVEQTRERFDGFEHRRDVTRAWLTNDLFEIMNRGKETETVVGPRPFHLNAFKLANPGAVDDFGASMQVWALLYYADRPLLNRLKEFFGRGLDPVLDRYDRTTPLDLETLAILGLADTMEVHQGTSAPPEPIRPLCVGQGYVMADDLRRLLAYEDKVPRHVLAEYVRTILGLHLSLFTLRLFKLLPDRVACAQQGKGYPVCPIDQGRGADMTGCPYHLEVVVDLTEDPSSSTAALARASAAAHLDGIARYVRSVILLNRVKDFASVQAAKGKMPPPRTVDDLLKVIAQPPPDMDGFFTARIADVLTDPGDTEDAEDGIVEDILGTALSPLEQYVELVCLQRLKNERSRLVTLVDALSQKNKPGGFLKQTAGARSPRWFVVGGDLLEALVQIAVVDRDEHQRLRSRSLLINDFIEWLRTRYGFVIYAPAHRGVAPEEQDAWRKNELALRERLRQIGFFTDLSDAYNSQTLRPRYTVRPHD